MIDTLKRRKRIQKTANFKNIYLYNFILIDSDSGDQGSDPGNYNSINASGEFDFSAITEENYYYLVLSSIGRLLRSKYREENW